MLDSTRLNDRWPRFYFPQCVEALFFGGSGVVLGFFFFLSFGKNIQELCPWEPVVLFAYWCTLWIWDLDHNFSSLGSRPMWGVNQVTLLSWFLPYVFDSMAIG
jgi:hypothetical protein